MADSVAQGATSPKSPASPRSTQSAGSPRSESGPAVTEQAVVEVDQQEVDEFDERLSSYTASLSSSVVDYPVEHGRRYHAYKRGVYLMPNDDREQVRLDVMHHIMVRTMSGRIFLAPLDENKLQNILDIGTGTGALAIELADSLPNAQVIGCDLSPTQTTWIPPNLKFELDDVESEWLYEPLQFDFIMSRYMASAIKDWPKLIGRIYENLTPGGWAEFQDWDMVFKSDDDALTENHDFRKWNKLFLEGLAKIDRDCQPGHHFHRWAESAGFVNLHERKFKVPLGPWPRDPLLKETGMMNLVQQLEGIEGFSLKIFQLLGWSRTEIEVLLAKVRKEIKSNTIHSYLVFTVVYGQKPGATA